MRLSTAFVFACLALPSLAQTGDFTVTPNQPSSGDFSTGTPQTGGFGQDTGSGVFSFNLNAELATTTFGRNLRIPKTPDAIAQADLFMPDGSPVEFRMLADPDAGWIIGTNLPGVTFELIQQVDGSYLVIAYKNGQIVQLTKDDIFFNNSDLGDYCFNFGQLPDSSIPFNISFMIDVSGSMAPYLNDVQRSMDAFIKVLPASAQCQLTTFTEQVVGYDLQTGSTQLGYIQQPQACTALLDGALVSRVLQPTNGGTSIAASMHSLYRVIAQYPDSSNLLALVTDGADGDDTSSYNEMMQARTEAIEAAGAYTFVNWLGEYSSSSPITRIADSDLVGVIGSRPVASDFFQEAYARLTNQFVITPQQCE